MFLSVGAADHYSLPDYHLSPTRVWGHASGGANARVAAPRRKWTGVAFHIDICVHLVNNV